MADTSVKTGGHQIDYIDEDEDVLATFTEELARNGGTPSPLGDWRYDKPQA